MGYSSSAIASEVLTALMTIVKDTPSSNVWRDHFYEIGRENGDGAITGKVWRFTSGKFGDDKRMAVSAGSFRINANGKIVRFPATTAKERRQAENAGAKRYQEIFEPVVKPMTRYTFTVIE